MKFKSNKAFAVLEIMLATMLSIGLIYLIMHSMSDYHQGQSDKQLGLELSPVISDMIESIDGTQTGSINLIKDKSAAKVCPNNSSGLLSNVSSSYLDSMEMSNFSLCSAKVNIQKVT